MRLAHAADFHLGFHAFYRSGPGGVNQRELDVEQAFNRTIDGIIAAAPDVVVMAGDLFHSCRPGNRAICAAFAGLTRLRAAITGPVVVIAGNHDTSRAGAEVGHIFKLLTAIPGLDVAYMGAERFTYPALDLAILAVPDAALRTPDLPNLAPRHDYKREVLVLHAPVHGIGQGGRAQVAVKPEQISEFWSYAALGDFHTRTQVADNAWYSGATEYTTSDVWGEARSGVPKGWILVDLETGTVEPQVVELARPVMDLPVIDAAGLTGEALGEAMLAAVAGLPDGAVVRQVVQNVERETRRTLDYKAIRRQQTRCLAYQLDLRLPEAALSVGREALRGRTIEALLLEYLGRRELPVGMDRAAFETMGATVFAEVSDAA